MNEDGQSPIPCSRPLAGFSHGAAGMALSLLRLAGVSQEERFRQGAQRAMEYERSIFSTARKNWPDFRSIGIAEARRIQLPEGEELCMTTWCHGAPGVGLGRLASLLYQDDAFMREEIEIAIQTTLEQGFGINHSLCHGDLGNLELLLSAEQILGEPRYRELAQTYTAMLLKSVEREGWLTGIPLGVESPGLMTGIAGIGYQFLRLAAPQQVPIVLTLDSPIRSEIR